MFLNLKTNLAYINSKQNYNLFSSNPFTFYQTPIFQAPVLDFRQPIFPAFQFSYPPLFSFNTNTQTEMPILKLLNPNQTNNNIFTLNSQRKPAFIRDYAEEFRQKTSSMRAEMAARVAEMELAKGVKEDIGPNGRGTDDSVDIRRYKKGVKNNAQWCASFASYCYGDGQNSSNSDTFGYTASSQAIKRKAIDSGHYAYKNSGYKPQRGDAAIWTNVNDPSHGHVGVVVDSNDKGVWIIEGNSGSAVKKNYYTYERLQNTARFSGYAKMNEWTA